MVLLSQQYVTERVTVNDRPKQKPRDKLIVIENKMSSSLNSSSLTDSKKALRSPSQKPKASQKEELA